MAYVLNKILDQYLYTKAYTTVDRVKVDPALALKILDTQSIDNDPKNPYNRKLRKYKLTEYTNDMKRGAWKSRNGQTVLFGWNGRLLDGQHRLWGVIESGSTIEFNIVFGADPKVVDTVDTGSSRSLADVITMMEKDKTGKAPSHVKQIEGAVKIILNHYAGNIYDKSRYQGNDRGYAFYSENKEEIQYSASKICKKGIVASKAACIALHYILSRNKSKAIIVDEFFDKFISGADLPVKSPILTLRNTFLAVKANPRTTLTTNFVIAGLIRSWEHYVKGESLSVLKVNSKKLPKIKTRIISFKKIGNKKLKTVVRKHAI